MPRNVLSLKRFSDILARHESSYRNARGVVNKAPVLDSLIADLTKAMQEKGVEVPERPTFEEVSISQRSFSFPEILTCL
jgi:hypothetical protein